MSCLFQIAELKRGAEIIVCTPGRMIDMLTANNGNVMIDLSVTDRLSQTYHMYGSMKTWKVMEFCIFIFQAWKIMELCSGS